MRGKLTFGLATVIAVALLWQHLHGGVPAHHLLAREDLPSLSNWWGVLLLPALAWLTLGRVDILRAEGRERAAVRDGAVAALLGLALAVFFTLGRVDVCQLIMQGVLLLALFFPIYRAACMLGFALGMTYAFGPVLPVLVVCVLAGVGFLLHQAVRLIASTLRGLFRQR